MLDTASKVGAIIAGVSGAILLFDRFVNKG